MSDNLIAVLELKLFDETFVGSAILRRLLALALTDSSSHSRSQLELPEGAVIGGGRRYRKIQKEMEELVAGGCEKELILSLCREIARINRGDRKKPLLPSEPNTTSLKRAARQIKKTLAVRVLNLDGVHREDEAFSFFNNYIRLLPEMLELYAGFLETATRVAKAYGRETGRYSYIITLGNHLRQHTERPHWDFAAAVIVGFGGKETAVTLRQAYKRGREMLRDRAVKRLARENLFSFGN